MSQVGVNLLHELVGMLLLVQGDPSVGISRSLSNVSSGGQPSCWDASSPGRSISWYFLVFLNLLVGSLSMSWYFLVLIQVGVNLLVGMLLQGDPSVGISRSLSNVSSGGQPSRWDASSPGRSISWYFQVFIQCLKSRGISWSLSNVSSGGQPSRWDASSPGRSISWYFLVFIQCLKWGSTFSLGCF